MNDRFRDASEREQRLDELATAYLKAQEAGQPPDRQALLDSNPELASELCEFFADQDRLERLAASPLLPDANRTPLPMQTGGEPGSPLPPPPRSFGDYTVLSALGQGGMGVVWKARQRRPDRLVALKMFRAGDLASPTDVQRFRNEAEVIAQLDHPHILPVYEVGEHDGVHYFSMKLVEGGSLAAHLDSYRADPRAAARLLATIARAVHYAHQRGILHRDLKPSNILLDSEGQPHVSDFGLAKRVETDSSLTQSGTLVGTPSYMAPEQTSGRKGAVTTATDVYGLGAVLYALLTGRPPFLGETVLETLERVREREPEPPRRSNPKVDRDLETICLKCLQKDPQRRYESAQALAEDLERWQGGKPIRARRVSRRERFGKWVRRRPALASLVAVSTLAVLGLVNGLLWHNDQLRDAAERERNQAQQANQQKEYAQKQRAFARQAADQMYTRVVEKWLVSDPGSAKLQREFLEEALRFYEELAQEPDADSSVQPELAKAYRRIGEIHLKLGRLAQAEQALGKAVDIAEKIAAEYPDQPVYQDDLAGIYYQLGNLNRQTRHPKESEAFFRKSLAIQRKLAALFPSDSGYRQKIGTALINLGQVLSNTGRESEKEEVYREARSVLEQVTVESPEAAHYHVALGGALNNLAILVARARKSAEARDLLEEAVRHQKVALRINPRHKQALVFLGNHYSSLSGVLLQTGETAKALDAIRESIVVAKRLVAEFPEFPEHRSSLAISQAALGQHYFKTGRPEEAESAYRSALATMEKAVIDLPHAPVNKRMLAGLHNSLAMALEAKGRHRDAVAEYRKSLQEHPDHVDALNNLAILLGDRLDLPSREPARAVELANRVVELQPKNWHWWRTLGIVRYRAGDWKGAVAALEKAPQLLGRDDEIARLFLGMAHWRAGDRERARVCYGQARNLAKGNKPSRGDLSRYRAEAADLIGGIDRPVPKSKEAQPTEK